MPVVRFSSKISDLIGQGEVQILKAISSFVKGYPSDTKEQPGLKATKVTPILKYKKSIE